MVKYFGVENEMVSLRSSILEKDNQIASLSQQVQDLGGQSPYLKMESQTSLTSSGKAENKRRGPPSPDQELTNAFGEKARGSFGSKR